MATLFTYDENEVQQATAAHVINYAGSYNVEIVRAEFSHSKKSGFPMFNVDYKVSDGTEAGNMVYGDFFVNDQNDPNKTEEDYHAFLKINSLLKALGGLKQGAQFDMETVHKTLVGKKLNITVSWRKNEYKGKVTYRPNVVQLSKVQNSSEPDMSKPRPQAAEVNTAKQGTDPFGSPSSAPVQSQPMGAAPLPSDADDPFNNMAADDPFAGDPFKQ